MNKSLSFIEYLPLLKDRQPLAHVLAILLSFLAWGLREALDPFFPPGYPYVIFFPAVILSSFLFGPKPGTTAAVLCGIFAWYFFIPPLHSFAVTRGTVIALLFYTFVVSVDIALVHWMQSANAHLRAARERNRRLAEERGQLAQRNELLFRELQHRVGNNLHMIGSMLALQMRTMTEPGARKALADASAKLSMIGNIQRTLYDTSGAMVSLDRFLAELAAQLIDAAGKPGIVHRIDAERGELLASEAVIPVALIMAEAIANAIEHGFKGREGGEIVVTLRRTPDELEISVRDDGNGLPDQFDLAAADSLGLKICTALSQQLHAALHLTAAPRGTVMRLTLPRTWLAA